MANEHLSKRDIHLIIGFLKTYRQILQAGVNQTKGKAELKMVKIEILELDDVMKKLKLMED